MSVISPYVYENDTYEDYLDGQLSEDDIHYLEVSSGPAVYVTGSELISDFPREGLAQQVRLLCFFISPGQVLVRHFQNPQEIYFL